jgi:hypothetical protein
LNLSNTNGKIDKKRHRIVVYITLNFPPPEMEGSESSDGPNKIGLVAPRLLFIARIEQSEFRFDGFLYRGY